MPLSSVQAAVIALVAATVSLIVGLGVMSSNSGGEVVAFAGTAIPALFLLANAIIHHGVTTAPPGEDASKPKTKNTN